MNEVTFNASASRGEKEQTEWLRLWCEDAEKNDLPRIALVGDSITEGYFPFVKAGMKGEAYVDYLASSYSVLSPAYISCVTAFLKDSDYALVHFNHGLHCFSVGDGLYFSALDALFERISPSVVATITPVYDGEREHRAWGKKISSRNGILLSLAKKHGCSLNDLHARALALGRGAYSPDGVHFTEEGYRALAGQVICSLRSQLHLRRNV